MDTHYANPLEMLEDDRNEWIRLMENFKQDVRCVGLCHHTFILRMKRHFTPYASKRSNRPKKKERNIINFTVNFISSKCFIVIMNSIWSFGYCSSWKPLQFFYRMVFISIPFCNSLMFLLYFSWIFQNLTVMWFHHCCWVSIRNVLNV